MQKNCFTKNRIPCALYVTCQELPFSLSCSLLSLNMGSLLANCPHYQLGVISSFPLYFAFCAILCIHFLFIFPLTTKNLTHFFSLFIAIAESFQWFNCHLQQIDFAPTDLFCCWLWRIRPMCLPVCLFLERNYRSSLAELDRLFVVSKFDCRQ